MPDASQELAEWFRAFKATPNFTKFTQRPVAYFCAEYALDQALPTYAGGLGVLAGDLVREANDRGLPLVAVGLLYHEGYICPTKEIGGRRIELCERVVPDKVGLTPILDATGARLIVKVPIHDRLVSVQAWKRDLGQVAVYLLDTDIASNTEADRIITNRLYVADKETRLKQEVILGIGGLRLLEAMDIHPSVYHLNEGHSAFLTLELVRHEMQERKIGFDEAKQFARRRIVLTNHTLVPAGNEVFSNDLVSLILGKYGQKLAVPVSDLVKLGLVQESSIFSMTILALRMSAIINAVSKLHAKKAKDIWTDHPMVAVTNGIHLGTWDRHAGADLSAPGAFWKAHQEAKDALLERIAAVTGKKWGRDELLVGWARRFASYKRPSAAIDDVEALAAIARTADRPVRLVFAGRPHPSDAEGAEIQKRVQEIIDTKLSDVAVYLPNYGLDLAESMVGGCDVWLNTPVVGYEACGTSGMKAALNGALPCTTNDGWIAEVDLGSMGWVIDNNRVTEDFLALLKDKIVPAYYDRGPDGTPAAWEGLMRSARDLILTRFSAGRMLREYIETLYL